MAFDMKGLFGRKNDSTPRFPSVSSAAGESRIPSAADLCADERLGVAFDTPVAPDFEETANRLVSKAAAHPAFHESGIDQYPRTLLSELGAYLAQVDAGLVRYRTELEATHRASLAAQLERCDNRLAELTFGKRERAAKGSSAKEETVRATKAAKLNAAEEAEGTQKTAAADAAAAKSETVASGATNATGTKETSHENA